MTGMANPNSPTESPRFLENRGLPSKLWIAYTSTEALNGWR